MHLTAECSSSCVRPISSSMRLHSGENTHEGHREKTHSASFSFSGVIDAVQLYILVTDVITGIWRHYITGSTKSDGAKKNRKKSHDYSFHVHHYS